MSYDSGSMTRMLDRLEKKGLIARSRSDKDRRIVKLGLTAQGQQAASQLPEIGADVLNEQLRGFSGADLATLIDLLSRFIANGIDGGNGAVGCETAGASGEEKSGSSVSTDDR
jgi:DNA-binding MarR family transcriptional regulator